MAYKKGSEKKELILDCAEEMFAESGFDAVTVRQITTRAQVRLASIHYYFNSKENLFHEVILRRANVINELRCDLLNEIKFSTLKPTNALLAICDAFISPLVVLSTKQDSGWRHYCRLIAITSLSNNHGLKETFSEFDATAIKFQNAIKLALPDISEQDKFYAFQFLLGSTISTFAESRRLEQLSEGKYMASDLSSICQRLVTYTAAGIESLGENTR
jgi:AcrR family transcriptional regulator